MEAHEKKPTDRMPGVKDRGGGALFLACATCGQPITHTNEYGMYCDNECGIEEDKAGPKDFAEFVEKLKELFSD